MYIVYDDMNEYAEAAISCYNLFWDDKCGGCPFFDVCGAVVDRDLTNAVIRCGEIKQKTGGKRK